ncbi:MAG TPA: cyclic nucleotide-binding domain-containing protein, partial [Pirellulaceae bacterium]
MDREERAVRRPERWDEPFGPRMTDSDVERLMRIEPFLSMDRQRFPASQSLADLLRYDARVVEVQPGDLVMREGDYGNSAFLILRGCMRVALESLPAGLLGRRERSRGGLGRWLAQLWPGTAYPEQRSRTAIRFDPNIAIRDEGSGQRIFLRDVPRVLADCRTAILQPGEFFGETSAMARGPRSASVFADEPGALLEIRWQGLRDLMRRSPEFKSHLETLYRRNSLESHLRETPFLRDLPPEVLDQIVQATEFESYGEFEWHRPFRQLQAENPNERIRSEPLIAEEGHYANGLMLIRGGFARLSQKYGAGHRTLAYLGRGQTYGLDTLIGNWNQREQKALPCSLRAVGYVDILRIPTRILEQVVFPRQSAPYWERFVEPTPQGIPEGPSAGGTTDLSTSMLEFI